MSYVELKLGTVTLATVTSQTSYLWRSVDLGNYRRTLGHNLISSTTAEAIRWELECYALDDLDTIKGYRNSGESVTFIDKDSASHQVKIIALQETGCIDPRLSRVRLTLETAGAV